MAFAFLPTAVASAKGETIMFSEGHSGADSLANLLIALVIFFSVEFLFMITLKEALVDTDRATKYGKYCAATLGYYGKTDIIGGGFIDRDLIGVPRLSLETVEDLKCWERFHLFIFDFGMYLCGFHIKAFEFVLAISFSALVCVFSMTLIQFDVQVWNILLSILGFVSGIATLVIFLNVCKFRERITVSSLIGLRRAQREKIDLIHKLRRSLEVGTAKDEGGNKRRIQDLEDLCKEIELLIEEIKSHAPLKIFKVIKVDYINIAKMGIGITTCAFTFGLRMSLESMKIL